MKNIKRKIFQIILTVFMVFSSCFLTGTVEAVDDTGNAARSSGYFTKNIYTQNTDVINPNEDKGPKPTFNPSDSDNGSDIDFNAGENEGQVWINKKVDIIDPNTGIFKITFQALGFKYRYVNDQNKKVSDVWKNPLAADSTLEISEVINSNFDLITSDKYSKKLEDGYEQYFESSDSVKFEYNNDINTISLSFDANAVKLSETHKDGFNYDKDGGAAFDVEGSFYVQVKSDVDAGTYTTNETNSSFTPATDNFYYYKWGAKEETLTYGFDGINWSNSEGSMKDIVAFSNITIPDINGETIKFSLGNKGENRISSPEDIQKRGNYVEGTPEKEYDDLWYIDVKDALKDVFDWDAIGIQQLYFYWASAKGTGENRDAYVRIEVQYSDGSWRILTPNQFLGNNGGNIKELRVFDSITIITKEDAILRENVDEDNDGIIKELFDNKGRITLVGITKEDIQQKKTAHVIDWDERTYQIDLYAAHNIDINTDPINIAIMLDFSGSMPWFVEQPGTSTTLSKIDTNENQVSEVIDKGNEEGTGLGAWDYKYYIKEQGEGSSYEYKPIAYNKYNMEEEIGGKVRKYAADTWYPIKSYSGGQKILDEENPLEDNKTIYIREGSSQTKLEALKDSLEYFITNLKSVSPGSKVAIIPFAGGILSGGTDEFVDVDSINVGSIFNNITLHGYTNQKAAMDKATELIDDSNLSKENTYALLFSDGDYSPDFTWKDENINLKDIDLEKSANDLKERVQLLFTAGIFAESTEKPSGVTHMESWASDDPDADGKKCVYIENTATDLIDAFADIFGKITFQINNVTIKDYIDNRFQLYNNITGEELEVGDTFAGGRIYEDVKGVYIQWDNVSLSYGQDGSYSWHRTIFVKAKDEYIGGNNVATNGDGSGIDVGNVHVDFGKPEVNVKVDFVVGNHDKTVFLGESVNLEDAESKLFDVNDLYNSKGDRLTMDSDGKTLDETDFDLSWYSEIDEHMQNVIMDSEVNAKTPIYPTEDDQVYYLVAKLKEETSETGALNNTNQNTNTDEDTLLAKNDMDTIPNPNDFTLVDHEISNYANENSKYGVYIVNAVSGSITINKNIEGNLINSQTQGDTVFTFSVVGETLDGKEFLREYKVLKFENEGPQSFTINGLQKGKYTITELKSIRYNLSGLSYDTADTTCPTEAVNKDAKQVVFYIGCDDDRSSTNIHATHGEATYTNEVVNDENYSDASFVKNTFTVDANGKVTISGQTTTDADSQNNE